MTQDPHRFADDPVGSELAQALREAQGDVLSPERVARVGAALQAAGIGATGAASAGGLVAGAGTSRPLMAKLLASAYVRVGLAVVAAGVVAAGVVGAASRWRTTGHGEAPSAPSDQASAPVTPEPPATPVDPGTAPPPLAEVPDAPPPPAEAATPSDAPPATAAATASARGGAHPQIQAPTAGVPSPREGALLLEARSVLGTNPARTLALLRAHEREFPRSQLAGERARIAAEAHRLLEK